MSILRKTATALAALGLLTAQAANAATLDRASSPVGESEEMAGIPSNAWIAVIAILAVALYSIIDASSDDDPTSP